MACVRPNHVNNQVLGLDPLIRCCLRLQVKDVLKLQSANLEDFPDILTLNGNHIVNKVEVTGVVVRVDKKERRKSYTVDDGTGVITCVCWSKQSDGQLIQNLDLPSSLEEKLKALNVLQQSAEQGYSIGDVIQVRGRLTEYRDEREMDVLDHCKIDNPNFEFERILNLPRLYEYYKKPYCPPKKVLAELNVYPSNNSDPLDKLSLLQDLQNFIKHHSESCSPDSMFTLSDILSWPVMKSKFQSLDYSDTQLKAAVSDCLAELAKNTGIVHSGREGRYEVIKADSPIAVEAIQLVEMSCKSGKNAECGCHILHLQDQLQKLSIYRGVEPAVVRRVVEVVEESGALVSLGGDRFLPVS